ncbi:MAG: homoserine dehydrogenase [Acidobacteriaceae bacterium]|nr:homoserine dehydrogenase [Acidobacteriaceae bacterium]
MNQSLMNSRFDSRASVEAPAKLCKVAIVGFGTVGSSVARILTQGAPAGLRLTHVCNRTLARKQQADWLPKDVKWTEDINEVLASDVDVIVEVIGGLSPAEEWVRGALNAGKSVVTANKQLIAHRGPELIALARKQKRHLAFGASVAGGVPVISGLQEGLAGDELFRIYGILNGTCNYILSQIESAGVPFSTTLAEAQRLGFAEADPTDDVDGFDARAKLAILARVGLRSQAHPNEILCRSISTIEAVDFEYAKQLGCTIRQISWAELDNSEEGSSHLLASVQPALVGLSSPLARVQGAQNLVMSTGRFGGETVFGGHGAGGNPTAVAIVSDIVGIAKAQQGTPLEFENSATPRSVSADFTTRHYLRFTVKDRPGIIATLASIFSECGINIDSVLQKPGYLKSSLPFVITLEACKTSLVEKARTQIAELDFLVQPCLSLPILD